MMYSKTIKRSDGTTYSLTDSDTVIRYPIIYDPPKNKLKLSLIYFTYRPGGFDMLANSLAKQTYKNYELIVVDDCPGRNLTKYLEDKGIPVAWYGPSKEKTYPDTPFNQVNAINTGIIHASGSLTILIEDYIWLAPDSLEKWNTVYNAMPNAVLTMTAAVVWGYKPPELISDVTVWKSEFNGDFSKCKLKSLWVAGIYDDNPWDWYYSAVPMDAWRLMNGVDERFDYWRGYPGQYFARQCRMNGLHFYLDISHVVHVIDHQGWDFGDKKKWHISQKGEAEKRYKPITEIYHRSPNNFSL